MTWYAWPAIAFLVVFILILQPRRRLSHYVVAISVASGGGIAVALLTLLVWGVTR